jgi:hypothetical protein
MLSQVHINPYSGRMTGSNDSRSRQPAGRLAVSSGASSSAAADKRSPSSQRAPKRQKLDHLEATKTNTNVSKYFLMTPGRRTLRSRPQVGPSTPASSHRSDPIVIDEDDAPDVVDPSHSRHTGSKASSPDPMDLISPEDVVSYAFDQNKPSPIRQLSLSFEETRMSPKDGESTARLRKQHNTPGAKESASRLEEAKIPLAPPLSRGGSIARAEASSKPGYVRTMVTKYNGSTVPHRNLQPKSRKNGMKPRAVSPRCPVWCPHN